MSKTATKHEFDNDVLVHQGALEVAMAQHDLESLTEQQLIDLACEEYVLPVMFKLSLYEMTARLAACRCWAADEIECRLDEEVNERCRREA